MEHIPTYIGVRDRSIVICFLLYDQSHSCNTPLSPHAYVLNLWVTLSLFRWKLGNTCSLLLFCLLLESYYCHHYYCCKLLIYRCGWESNYILVDILVFPSSRTINLGNTSQRRLQRSPILVGITCLESTIHEKFLLIWFSCLSLSICCSYRPLPWITSFITCALQYYLIKIVS